MGLFLGLTTTEPWTFLLFGDFSSLTLKSFSPPSTGGGGLYCWRRSDPPLYNLDYNTYVTNKREGKQEFCSQRILHSDLMYLYLYQRRKLKKERVNLGFELHSRIVRSVSPIYRLPMTKGQWHNSGNKYDGLNSKCLRGYSNYYSRGKNSTLLVLNLSFSSVQRFPTDYSFAVLGLCLGSHRLRFRTHDLGKHQSEIRWHDVSIPLELRTFPIRRKCENRVKGRTNCKQGLFAKDRTYYTYETYIGSSDNITIPSGVTPRS